jgi:hypothetical protein
VIIRGGATPRPGVSPPKKKKKFLKKLKLKLKFYP